MDGASNRLIDVEDLSEEELKALHRHYARLAQLAQRVDQQSHPSKRRACGTTKSRGPPSLKLPNGRVSNQDINQAWPIGPPGEVEPRPGRCLQSWPDAARG